MNRQALQRIDLPGGAMLCRAGHAPDCQPLFDLDNLTAAGAVTEREGGRGSIRFIRQGNREYVLRRYLRGGLPARLSRDRYLWFGEERTRSFREFRLLVELRRRSLPVPQPVAARYRRGRWSYRAEIITERLPARSLAERWLDDETSDADWQLAGRCIRRFHDAGVQHADLNAHNIMLDGQGGAWLLDFDRGRIRRAGAWQQRSLSRLARSLAKIAATTGRGSEWRQGYELLRAAHDAAVNGPG